MAKLSRNSLKALVKECLVEILSEGIGGKVKNNPSRSTTRKAVAPKKKKPVQKAPVNKMFESNIRSTVAEITGDVTMQELLADTARTTLQEQNRGASLNPAPEIADYSDSGSGSGIDLSGIFDDSKKNWSLLAFEENKNKSAE